MNCDWLQKILEEITELSRTDWSTSAYKKALADTMKMEIDDTDEYYQDVFLRNFENEIENFEKLNLLKYFEYLHFSIIGGECFHFDFSEIIKKTISICGKFQYSQFNEEIEENLQLSLENKIQELEPLSILKKSLIEFQSNSNFLLRLVENPSLNTLFDLSDQTQDILDELKNNISFIQNDLKKELILSIKNNLILLRKDFYLKYEIEDLKTLLIAKNELDICSKYFKTAPTLSNILELLIEKSVFLIRKYIIRKYKEDNVHNENYVFLGKESNFDFISHKLKLEVFKDWDRYSKNHFLSEVNYEKTIILNRYSQKILKIGKVGGLDFHSLTKYYKDLNRDFEKLKSLSTEIDTIPVDNVIFDTFALNKMKNYISNNIFSEAIRNISYDLNVDEVENIIKSDIQKIQKIQNESFLNNFFPYFKICDFLNIYIEKKINKISLNNNDSEESIQCIDKSLKLLKKYFEIFKVNLKWSKVHLNYSYQLPFNECLKKHEISGLKINVFSASTFSLPIEFEKYDEFEKHTEAFLLRIENEVKSLNNLNSFVKIFKKDRDELQEDIKSNSKKNIELLGIFSAIIALLFQGAYTVNSNVAYEDKLFTLIAMFLVLVSFLLMLRSFYSKKFERDELITIKIISFLIIPLLLITTIILFKIFK
jgi:hypothetical protein